MSLRLLLASSLILLAAPEALAKAAPRVAPPPVAKAPPAPREAVASGNVLLVYPDRMVVIDPASPDDWGNIPVKGTVNSALWLMERHLLLVHLPGEKAMVVIDTRPDSVTRYRALATYHAPEFADPALRFAQSGGRVYLARAREAVLIFDPPTLLAKIGLYAADFLPLVYSTATRVLLADRIVSLEAGQVTVESTRPRPGEISAPRYLRLPYRPTGLLTHREGGSLYLACRADDGTGRLLALDPATMEITQEIAVPHAITSMAWLDDGRLCMLSAPVGRLAILDVATWRWTRIWQPEIPGKPLRLLSAAAPPAPGSAGAGAGFGEVYEP